MAIILNDPYARGVGAEVGSGLGSLLNAGLGQLAQNKLGVLQQRNQQAQQAQGLAALGIPHKQAAQLSMLDPKLQQQVVKNYLAGAENAGLNEALGGVMGTGMQGLPQQQAGQQESGMPEMKGKGITFEEALRNPRLKPEHRLKIAEMQQRREREDRKYSHEEKKLLQSQEKDLRREEKVEQKIHRPKYEKILEADRAANDEDREISRLETLIKRGNLPNPTFHNLLNTLEKGIWGFGINLKALEGADAEEFQKISNRFLRGAKSQLGGGILSDNDIKTFLAQYPSLSQSDEGKWRIIQSMKALNEMKRVVARSAEDIVKENKGKVPADIEKLADTRAQKELARLKDQFVNATYGTPYEEAIPKRGLNKYLDLEKNKRSSAGFGDLI